MIRECAACHLMVLDPKPTEEALHEVYNEGYFENSNLTQSDVSKVYGYVDYISERINKQRNYLAISRRLRHFVVPAHDPPRLLDYGCDWVSSSTRPSTRVSLQTASSSTATRSTTYTTATRTGRFISRK